MVLSLITWKIGLKVKYKIKENDKLERIGEVHCPRESMYLGGNG